MMVVLLVYICLAGLTGAQATCTVGNFGSHMFSLANFV